MTRVRTEEQPWGLLVELCAPEVRNALDPETVSALLEVLGADGPGVVVLAGQGDVFCAGGDLRVMAGAADLSQLLAREAARFADLVEAVVTSPRPVVAAVRGAAVGGGMSLALACDVRIAGRSARLVPGAGRWGLPPDGGASALLPAAVGLAAATAVLVRGEALGATSPLAPLVFSEVVHDELVLVAAVAEAERLAAHPGARTAKAVTRAALLPALRAQRELELAALLAAAEDPAVRAALEAAVARG